MTPKARTRKHYEDLGFRVADGEQIIRLPSGRVIRRDLFGMFDLLAIDGDRTIGIQATSGSNIAARVKKLEEHPDLALWCAALGREAVVMGWRKGGGRGKRKTWIGRIVGVTPPGAEKFKEGICRF